MNYAHKKISSPTGDLHLIASDKGLVAVSWGDYSLYQTAYSENADNPILIETEKQLAEYFDKKRFVFDIKLDFDISGTEFQKKVWQALLTIPFGETRTYGQIAKQVGSPDAVRAVGGAANKNPIPVIVPCHRVIGASGRLVGFGGGLLNKSYLLQLENIKSPTLF